MTKKITGYAITRTDRRATTTKYTIDSSSSLEKTLVVHGDSDFELVIVQLNNADPHPGRLAFVVLPKIVQESKLFNFLKLSPELRNMVYHELLVFTEPILLKGRTKPLFGITNARNYILQKHPPKPWLDILRTNKQVYREAIQIFLGNNTFSCSSNTTLTLLGKVLDSRFRSLRHIVIDQALYSSRVREFAQLLTAISNLKSLRIEYYPALMQPEHIGSVVVAIKPRQLGELMFALFHQLFNIHQDLDKVFNIISFVGNEYRILNDLPSDFSHDSYMRHKDKCLAWCRDREAYTTGIRAYVAKQLRIMHPGITVH